MKYKPYRYGIYLGLQFFVMIASLLPRVVLRGFAFCFGVLLPIVLPWERKKAEKNLRYAYGDALPERAVLAIARQVFLHFAYVVADLLKLYRMSSQEMQDMVIASDVDRERFLTAAAKDKGFICLAAHIGNWELLGTYLTNAFAPHFKAPVVVIGKRIYYDKYNEAIISFRERFNVKTIYRDESFRDVVKNLKAGGGVGILPDQDVDSIPGIFVNFFGKKAYTTDAVAKLSYMTGAPIVPAGVVREGSKYRLYVEDAFAADPSRPKDEEIVRVTQKVSDALERFVRRFPDQWVWMHNRWKTQPK